MRKVKKSPSQMLAIEELPPVTHYLSTGCTILDLAIAGRLPGGFGAGRISHIIGSESSGKSIIALEPLGSAQRQGGYATFIDAEMTLDLVRAKNLFGINTDELKYISTEETDNLTIDYIFDNIVPILEEAASDTKNPSAVTIDSLSAIPSNIEIEEDLDKGGYGVSRAKILSKCFRKHIWKLSKSNLGMIFVDQTRQNIGVTFGKQHTFSGGEALKFYASTRLFTKHESEIKNKHGIAIGINVSFKVEKNKIAPPFRKGSFRVLFDYGIDDIGTSIMFLKETRGDKGTYTVLKESFKSLDSAISFIEDNNFEVSLQNEVYDIWREVHEKSERKARER